MNSDPADHDLDGDDEPAEELLPIPGIGRAVELAVQMKTDRKSTRLNSSHIQKSRMPSSA